MNQKTAWQMWPLAIVVTLMAFAHGRSRGQDYEPPDPVFPLPAFHERPTSGAFSRGDGSFFVIPRRDQLAVLDADLVSAAFDSIRNVINWSCFLPDFSECVESWRKTAMLAWSATIKDQTPSAGAVIDQAMKAMGGEKKLASCIAVPGKALAPSRLMMRNGCSNIRESGKG